MPAEKGSIFTLFFVVLNLTERISTMTIFSFFQKRREQRWQQDREQIEIEFAELRARVEAEFDEEAESFKKIYEALIQNELKQLAELGLPATYTDSSPTIVEK